MPRTARPIGPGPFIRLGGGAAAGVGVVAAAGSSLRWCAGRVSEPRPTQSASGGSPMLASR